MGKTSRRTKAKKKDFNKVKLKVGKKKPAAENSTSTAFKSQSVYIPEQLQSQENIPAELLTHRKQSVDDLLSHLNHFSPTFRCQALNGLKEILSNHQSNKSIDGMKICERVIRSVTDVDSQVRKASTSVLWHIFSVVPERQISPSFPLILSHLFCAMSHISKDVQRDSLKVVDLCFEFFPNLVCSDENRLNLLQHFIELISSKQGERLANSRVLAMNLSKKESAIAWRIKVLTRLSALLKNTPTVDPTNTVNFDNKVNW
uniref:Pre-rRNA-processing protein Ipi1 N-terminal domain-containing protein n=1 Tax=Ciona savignyi TaxID=51511 RepID=H2ZP16_CIOSA